ncbi:hypothetical protein B6N60_00590 [Richelia sinica FACHB-800]|uniref:Uncharacterized protein n=1 Tax=Richelia sinica FACHB-800 TaxID=1357546 RepID=A0A975Y3B6_9NOST|nr:hypothetical protein B6N60_00590 [Richelia sinica FACHB-800]
MLLSNLHIDELLENMNILEIVIKNLKKLAMYMQIIR